MRLQAIGVGPFCEFALDDTQGGQAYSIFVVARHRMIFIRVSRDIDSCDFDRLLLFRFFFFFKLINVNRFYFAISELFCFPFKGGETQ